MATYSYIGPTSTMNKSTNGKRIPIQAENLYIASYRKQHTPIMKNYIKDKCFSWPSLNLVW